MKWFIPDVATMGNSFSVASVNSGRGTTIPLNTQVIHTGGFYVAGDGGEASYKKSLTEPIHGGKWQSADGAWWELCAPVVNPKMFGVVGLDDIGDNDTVNLQVFFDYIRDGGQATWNNIISYVEEGQLLLSPTSNAFDSIGPVIGGAATIKGLGINDAPMLKIWSAVYSGAGSSKNYINGSLGNLTIISDYQSGWVNNHGISWSGCVGWQSGITDCTNLGGRVFYDPGRNVLGNPDYYENYNNNSQGIVARGCNGVYIANAPSNAAWGDLGFIRVEDSTTKVATGDIDMTSAQTARISGASFAGGGGAFSMAGAPSGNRISLSDFEIDGAENGILINGSYTGQIVRSRAVKRINISAGTSFPRYVLKLDGNVQNMHFDLIVRFEADVTLGTMGTILDFSNSGNLYGITINMFFTGNAALINSLKPSDIISNPLSWVANSAIKVNVNSKCIFNTLDTYNSSYAKIAAITALPIAVGGYGTDASVVQLNGVRIDRGGLWNAGVFGLIVPRAGPAKVSAKVVVGNIAIGATIKAAIVYKRGAAWAYLAETSYTNNTGSINISNTISIPNVITTDLATGDQVSLMVSATSGAAVLVLGTSSTTSNILTFEYC